MWRNACGDKEIHIAERSGNGPTRDRDLPKVPFFSPASPLRRPSPPPIALSLLTLDGSVNDLLIISLARVLTALLLCEQFALEELSNSLLDSGSLALGCVVRFVSGYGSGISSAYLSAWWTSSRCLVSQSFSLISLKLPNCRGWRFVLGCFRIPLVSSASLSFFEDTLLSLYILVDPHHDYTDQNLRWNTQFPH